MTIIERVAYFLATLGSIGYLPCSGTVATLITFIFLLCCYFLGFQFYLIRFIIPLVGFSIIIIHFVLKWFSKTDPPEIVLDEVVGYCFAMSIFPLKPLWLIATAILFRIFDISKILGIGRFEKMGGAAGIILDDLLAGFYTQITIILSCIGYDLWLR